MGLSPATAPISNGLCSDTYCYYGDPSTPFMPKHQWFGIIPFRSPLLGESLLFSSPAGNKMFQFPAFASACADDIPSEYRVVPFGYPRIYGYLRLPAAFRSLSRPSSPPRAKASTWCPCFLCSRLPTCGIFFRFEPSGSILYSMS